MSKQWLARKGYACEHVNVPLDIQELNTNNVGLARGFEKVAQAENKKLTKFDEKTGKVDNQLKLVREIKDKFAGIRDALVPFKTPNDFRDLKGTSSHEDTLKVTSIDKALAQPGTYDIEVMNLANTDSIMTYGFETRDKSEVGVGYIAFNTPEGETKEVYINSDNNTLDGVAATINAAKLGIKAYVVNDGTDADEPWRLVISGEKTGWRKDYEYPEIYLLDGDLDFDIDRTRDAQSAIIKFNGQPIMADENLIKDLLPGVNINLKDAKPGQIVKLDIEPDYEKIGEKAKNFVDKMNEVLGFIQNQNKLGKDSHKDPTKALGGDVVLKSLESRMRSIIQLTENDFEGAVNIQRLQDVGIVFNRNGTLDFDDKKFQKQLESNFDEVAGLFAGSGPLGGFANRMLELVDGVTRTGDGIMTIREEALKSRLDRNEQDKERATTRANERMERVRKQFSRADSALQQLQNVQAQQGAAPAVG